MRKYIVELKFVKFVEQSVTANTEDEAIELAKEYADCDIDMCDLDTMRVVEIK